MFSTVETGFKVMSVLVLIAVGLLFLRLIAMARRTEGPHSLRTDGGYAVRSVGVLLVWLGAMAIAAFVRVGQAVLGTLYEASADVGEWYVRRRGLDLGSDSRAR
jgi:hypothetical protein